MTYPPKPHCEHRREVMAALMRERPLAHLFTSDENGQFVTRLPFVLDEDGDSFMRLRAHMNAQNPQAARLDGASALAAFSGPDTYVSPNWRTRSDRGATWDYTAVHVWGRARVRPERDYFEQLIVDLAKEAEPRFEGVSEKPDWSLSSVTREYVDRLFPHVTTFEINIDRVQGISKLHQDFPEEDAICVAAHLEKLSTQTGGEMASLIKSASRRHD